MPRKYSFAITDSDADSDADSGEDSGEDTPATPAVPAAAPSGPLDLPSTPATSVTSSVGPPLRPSPPLSSQSSTPATPEAPAAVLALMDDDPSADGPAVAAPAPGPDPAFGPMLMTLSTVVPTAAATRSTIVAADASATDDDDVRSDDVVLPPTPSPSPATMHRFTSAVHDLRGSGPDTGATTPASPPPVAARSPVASPAPDLDAAPPVSARRRRPMQFTDAPMEDVLDIERRRRERDPSTPRRAVTSMAAIRRLAAPKRRASPKAAAAPGTPEPVVPEGWAAALDVDAVPVDEVTAAPTPSPPPHLYYLRVGAATAGCVLAVDRHTMLAAAVETLALPPGGVLHHRGHPVHPHATPGTLGVRNGPHHVTQLEHILPAELDEAVARRSIVAAERASVMAAAAAVVAALPAVRRGAAPHRYRDAQDAFEDASPVVV